MKRLGRWLRGGHRVTIRYKSGQVQVIRCRNFSTKMGPQGLTGVEWDHPRPRPMFFNVDEVESIWCGR